MVFYLKVMAIVITDCRYDPKDLDSLGSLCGGVDVYAVAIGDMIKTGAERQKLERIACNRTDQVKTWSVYAERTAEDCLEEVEQLLCPGKSTVTDVCQQKRGLSLLSAFTRNMMDSFQPIPIPHLHFFRSRDDLSGPEVCPG